MPIKETLKKRSKIYGDYSQAVYYRSEVMAALKNYYHAMNGRNMPEIDATNFYDIVGKLIRLASTPSHIDSWRDIAGYATLVKNYYKEKENANQ